MFKRLSLIASIVAVLAMAGTAQAHYLYTFSGWIYHSVGCDIIVKQLPSQKNNAGSLVCDVTGNVTVYCANPNGYTFAGNAGIITASGTGAILPDTFTKTKGQGFGSVTIFKKEDFIAFCPNANWSVSAVVVDDFSGTMKVYDGNGVLAPTVTGEHCTLGIPPGTLPTEGDAYTCQTQTVVHNS